MHWRKMFDDRFLGVWDLDGKQEATVELTDVKAEELTDPKGGKSKRPTCGIKGTDKRLVLNKTNAKAIADAFGNDTEKWRGEKVILYVAKVSAFGSMQDAIRVKIKEGK